MKGHEEKWRFGKMEISKNGNFKKIKIWKSENLEKWKNGNLEKWKLEKWIF